MGGRCAVTGALGHLKSSPLEPLPGSGARTLSQGPGPGHCLAALAALSRGAWQGSDGGAVLAAVSGVSGWLSLAACPRSLWFSLDLTQWVIC